jgi:hypothetical protein
MSSFACVVRTNRSLPVSPSLAPALLLLLWTSESEAGAPGFVEKQNCEVARLLVVPGKREREVGCDSLSSAREQASERPTGRAREPLQDARRCWRC